ITKLAYSIVTVYGMNDKIGNVSFYDSKQSEYNFTKPYSDATAELIDNEVKALIDGAYTRTKDLLKKRANELEIIAQELLEKEIIFQGDLERLIGKRPFEHQTTYERFTNGSAEEESEEGSETDPIEEIKKNVKTEVEEEDSIKASSTETEETIEEEDNK
ncbi:MAG: peptidase M41, partial [Cyclobacteriaceae bacterium]